MNATNAKATQARASRRTAGGATRRSLSRMTQTSGLEEAEAAEWYGPVSVAQKRALASVGRGSARGVVRREKRVVCGPCGPPWHRATGLCSVVVRCSLLRERLIFI